jgi:hypothetical protein
VCNFEWAKILFVDGGFDSKLQHHGPWKISWNKLKTSHLDLSSFTEGDIMQNHEQKRKVKNQDAMGKAKFFLSTLPFSPWVVLAIWLHVGTPQKIQEKWT